MPSHATTYHLSSQTTTCIDTKVPVLVITTPPKIWCPKVKLDYIPLDYATDVDDEFFIYKSHGQALIQWPLPDAIPTCDDIQLWDDTYLQELHANLRIGPTTTPELCEQLVSIIKDNWDAFFEAGVQRCILGFEFCVDTGASAPVCCHQPCYGPHEGAIIQEQIDALKNDQLLRECE